MPDLRLHIGTHKTGTTSVQRFFAQNRAALREAGVWYPEFTIADFPDHYAHHRLAHAIAGRDDVMDRDDARRFCEVVLEQSQPGETVFMSAEPLYRHVLPPEGGSVNEAIADEAAYHRYASAVRDCVDGFDVTILIMLRRQDLFAESLYAEHVLSSGYGSDISTFLEERRALFDYRTRLDVWAEYFGAEHIEVRAFEPADFGMPIERLFVEWVGAAWSDEFNVGQRRNVTLPRTLVEFKRKMNSGTQGATVNAQYRRWLEQLASAPSAADLPDLGKYYLEPHQRVALMQQHDRGNRSIAEEFLGRAQLFSRGVLDDLAEYRDRPQLTARDFQRISKLLFRMIASG